MSETLDPAPRPQGTNNTDIVKLVYLLYFAGFITGLTAVIGVVMAYLRRDQADTVATSHFTYQIRTFWIGVLMIVSGTLLAMIMVGFLIIAFWIVWTIVRCVKGFLLMNDGRPVPDPETWLW